MSVFYVPLHQDMLPTFVRGLFRRHGHQMQKWHRGHIFLPSYESVQQFKSAVARHAASRHIVLPRLYSLSRLREHFLPMSGNATRLGRLFYVFSCIKQMLKSHPGLRECSSLMGQWNMAKSFLSLAEEINVDQVQVDQIQWNKIGPDPQLAQHVTEKLSVFRYLYEMIDQQYDFSGKKTLDSIDRIVLDQAPLFVYALTGNPEHGIGLSLFELLHKRSHGVVIHMSNDCDKKYVLCPTHPSYETRMLLERINAPVSRIELFVPFEAAGAAGANKDDDTSIRYQRFLEYTFMPAQMHEVTPNFAPFQCPWSLIRCKNNIEEAKIVSLLVREALYKKQTILIVSPEHNPHIVERLGEYAIVPTASRGHNISHTQYGKLFLQVSRLVCCADFDQPTLIELLWNPLIYGGHNFREDLTEIAQKALLERRDMDLLSCIDRALTHRQELGKFWAGISKVLKTRRPGHMLQQSWEAVRHIARGLSIWEHSELYAFVKMLHSYVKHIPFRDPEAWLSFLGVVMQEYMVKLPGSSQVFMSSLRDADMTVADNIVLCGLNEAIWPSLVQEDAWFGCILRDFMDCPPAQRSVGQQAYTFIKLLSKAGKKNVYLTYAKQVLGSKMSCVSTFIQRMEVCFPKHMQWIEPGKYQHYIEGLQGTDVASSNQNRLANGDARHISRHPNNTPQDNLQISSVASNPSNPSNSSNQDRLENGDARHIHRHPNNIPGVQSKGIKGLLSQLHVTQIYQLLKNPASFYYANTLGEIGLDDQASYANKTIGSALHKVLHACVEYLRNHSIDNIDEFEFVHSIVHQGLLGSIPSDSVPLALGWLRQSLLYFIEWEMSKQQPYKTLLEYPVQAMYRDTLVKGRIDRVDLYEDGTCILMDYKKGRVPSNASVQSGEYPHVFLYTSLFLDHKSEHAFMRHYQNETSVSMCYVGFAAAKKPDFNQYHIDDLEYVYNQKRIRQRHVKEEKRISNAASFHAKRRIYMQELSEYIHYLKCERFYKMSDMSYGEAEGWRHVIKPIWENR